MSMKCVLCLAFCLAVHVEARAVEEPRDGLTREEVASRCRHMGAMLSGQSVFDERVALTNYREVLAEIVRICVSVPGKSKSRRDRERVVKEILSDGLYESVEAGLLKGMSSGDERVKGMSMLVLCKILGSESGRDLMICGTTNLEHHVRSESVIELSDIDKVLLDCAAFIGDLSALKCLKMLFSSDRKSDMETLRFASRVLSESGFPVAKFSPDSLLLTDPSFLTEAFGAVSVEGMYYGYEKYGLWQIGRLADKVCGGSRLSHEEKVLLTLLLVRFPRDNANCKVVNLSSEQACALHTSIVRLAECKDAGIVEIAVKGVFSSVVMDDDRELLRSLLVSDKANVRSRAAYALAHRSVDCIMHCSRELIKMLEDDSLEARREAFLALKVGLREPASNWEAPEAISRERARIEKAYNRGLTPWQYEIK